MHPALHLEEILLNIFGHCQRSTHACIPDVVSVARTCRAFKEPALDVLWEELPDISPLVRCLPKACYQPIRYTRLYSFRRSLTEEEWDALRSYACRIRSLGHLTRGVGDQVITILFNPPTPEPLFPNLQRLRHRHDTTIRPHRLLQLPFPSLTRLNLLFYENELHTLQDVLQPLLDFSPNIRFFTFKSAMFERRALIDSTYSNYICSWICRWPTLKSAVCPEIPFDTNTLQHLSHIRTLSHLEFTLDPTLLPLETPLLFPHLHKLTVLSRSLATVSHFLSYTRLPTLTDITTEVSTCPSPQEFNSFLYYVQKSATVHKIETMGLHQVHPHGAETMNGIYPCLSLDHLRPWMLFRNLRELDVDVEWSIFLTTDDLLSLALAWRRLERISLNRRWGWNTNSSGITPDGFLQLLRICSSLHQIALAWDIRDYTLAPPSGWLARSKSTLPTELQVHVLDSRIEPCHMDAMTAFFADVLTQCPSLSVSAWNYGRRGEFGFRVQAQPQPQAAQDYEHRWYAVFPLSARNWRPSFTLHGDEPTQWPDRTDEIGLGTNFFLEKEVTNDKNWESEAEGGEAGGPNTC